MALSYYARTDSNNANNPALNLNKDPAVLITFVEPSGGGDVILDHNGGLPDPDTLVEINGTDYTFTFQFAGTMPTQKNNGAQQVPDQFEGDVVLLITVQDYPSPGDATRLAFLPESNATAADMDSFGKGAISVQNLDTSPPPTAICFVRGTLIATPDGERPVEALCAGDMVLTSRGAATQIRWIAHSHFTYGELVAEPNVRPVCVPKDWLGRGMPHSDLWVSPQHCIVLRGWKTELNLAREAVFVRAKHLMGDPKAPGPSWFAGVDYFHVMCDAHEILRSNGLESESFCPGEEAMRVLGAEARASLRQAMPATELNRQGQVKSALTTANAHEAAVIRPTAREARSAA